MGLDLVYDNMKEWRDRFPGIKCVSAFLFKDEMRIRIDWEGDVTYTYVIPQTAIDLHNNLEAFGEMIFSEAEKAYKIHTIGEE
jgi:hypothetical protein